MDVLAVREAVRKATEYVRAGNVCYIIVCICMYVYMYVCMYVCTYVCVCIIMYVCMCVYVHVHIILMHI